MTNIASVDDVGEVSKLAIVDEGEQPDEDQAGGDEDHLPFHRERGGEVVALEAHPGRRVDHQEPHSGNGEPWSRTEFGRASCDVGRRSLEVHRGGPGESSVGRLAFNDWGQGSLP